MTRPDFSRDTIIQRPRQHPSAAAIARANRHLWRRRFRTLADAAMCCWACEVQPASLERAHIQPVRFGGSDEPSNFLLLCSFCHIEQDDEAPPVEQLRWLREHKKWSEHWKEKLAENKARLDSLPPIDDEEFWNATRSEREVILERRRAAREPERG